MADYQNAFETILEFEGKTLTDTAGDRGGRTFAGITQKNFPNCPIWAILEQCGTQNGEECSEAMGAVKQFYYPTFWQPIGGDYINDQAYANKLVSDAVKGGVETAIKLAQQALNVPQTGKMDEVTLNAINA